MASQGGGAVGGTAGAAAGCGRAARLADSGRMKRLAAASLVLLAAACGGATDSPAGSFALDREAFVAGAVQTMRDAGRIPGGAEAMARQMLNRVRFTLDLAADGSFRAAMDAGEERHDYSGTWTRSGNRVTVNQTHEDGEPVADRMAGTWDGECLRLDHAEDGMVLCYVLRRQPAAEPR